MISRMKYNADHWTLESFIHPSHNIFYLKFAAWQSVTIFITQTNLIWLNMTETIEYHKQQIKKYNNEL
jgi:hypothetical protein